MIKLELPIDAVNMILGALGELPSKTNAMALMLLIAMWLGQKKSLQPIKHKLHLLPSELK